MSMSSVPPTPINRAFITAGTKLNYNNSSYILTENLTMSSPFLFNMPSGGVTGLTFNGNGFTITVTGSAPWPGLFSNSVSVSNLGILSTGTTAPNRGWFFDNAVVGTAINCYSTGNIGSSGGGIFGSRSIGTATSCYSTGNIGAAGGGIFGAFATGTATSCYSKGIIGAYGGGISGAYSSNYVQYCYSTGKINSFGGGICGAQHNNTTVKDCYSTGNIDPYGGGINGGSDQNVAPPGGTITNCYSTGQISNLGGGIVGGYGFVTTAGIRTSIQNCYTTGCPADGRIGAEYYGALAHVTVTRCNSNRNGVWEDSVANKSLTGLESIWRSLYPNFPYQLLVNPQILSNNVSLSNVYVNGLSQIAGISNAYTYQFKSKVSSSSYRVTTSAPDALIKIFRSNNSLLLSGIGDIAGTLPLVPGSNSFFIDVLVFSEPARTARYSLTINTPSDDANLSAVYINNELVPINTSNEFNYTFNSSASSISYRILTTSFYAQVRIVGGANPQRYREVSGTLPLTGVSTPNSILVIAQDMSTKRYRLTITKGLSGDAGISAFYINGQQTSPTGVTEFNTYVPSISFRVVTSSPVATANLNGISGIQDISGTLPLANNPYNTFVITVTAANGLFTRYTFLVSMPVISQDYSLSAIYINGVNITPTFFGTMYDYSFDSNVSSAAFRIITTHPAARISVADLSGGSDLSGSLPLSSLTNPFTVRVVAQGGYSTIYDLTINKAPIGAPTNVVASTPASGTVLLSWTPPADTGIVGITSYNVYTSGRIISTNTASTTITDLSNNTLYTFQVSAVTNLGEGTRSPVTQIVTSQLASSVASFISSGNTADFTNALTPSLADKPAAILNTRAAINNAVTAMTDQQRQDLTVAALSAINSSGTTLAVSSNTTGQLLATMNTVNTAIPINTNLPVVIVIPSYSTGASPYTATIDLSESTAEVNGTTLSYANIIAQLKAYIVFELPNSTAVSTYQLTMTYKGSSLTLVYNGTVLIDQNSTEYTANDTLNVGGLTIPLIGLGSLGGGPILSQVIINSNTITEYPYTEVLTSNAPSIPIDITTTDTGALIVIVDSTNTPVLSSNTGHIMDNLPLRPGNNIFQIVTGGEIYTFTISNPRDVSCFPTGTRILTVAGYKKVEDLETGELVMTADGLRVPVKMYEIELPATTTETAPYRIPKGTFGPAAPANDLILSPMHFFQIKKGLWMFPKHAALFSEKVTQIMVGSPITYYHVECPQYLRDNLVVDGTVVESFGAKQLTSKPYTYNPRLKGYTRQGYTRVGYSTAKSPTKA